MITDAYTKAILTIIAACLVWMCLNSITPVTQAQAKLPEPTPVVLVDVKGAPIATVPVRLTNQSVSVDVTNPSLAVAVSNPSLAVAVRSIQRGAAWDPIQVQVMREPPTQRPIP
jgi:hypothetical protein